MLKQKSQVMMRLNLKNLQQKLNYNRWNSVCYRYFMVTQYCWFKITGLSPWALNTLTKGDENNISYFSCIGSFYSVLLIVLYVSIVIINYIFYTLDFNSETEQVLSMVLFERLEFILSLSLFIMMLIFIIRHKSLISVINRITRVGKKLRIFGDFNKELDSSIYLLFIIDFLLVSSLTIGQIYYDFPAIVIVHFVLECFFQGGMIIQFVIFLNVITKHFETINSRISKLDNSGINTEQVNDPSCVINITVPESNLQITELDIYIADNSINAYVDLYKICDDLKKCYGLPILMDILSLSVKNLILLYFMNWNSLRHLPILAREVVRMIMTLTRNKYLLIALTSNVTKTINQSQETIKILNLVILRTPATPEVKNQLAQFSSIISHFNVKFKACDVVPLDRTLLVNIYYTITAYLVIILLIRINVSPYIE